MCEYNTARYKNKLHNKLTIKTKTGNISKSNIKTT